MSVFAANPNAIVNAAAYQDGRRVANVALSDVSATLRQPGCFVWIGLHEPSTAVLDQVQQEFQLHELAIEDAHCAHQRPKLESYGNTIFIVLRTAHLNAQHHAEFGETHFLSGPILSCPCAMVPLCRIPRCGRVVKASHTCYAEARPSPSMR